MSRLRELRLNGFKTFADPTRFVFERGVTAVIGPNGSGKSNMADAVRWVLGEQSNRSLRTRRADEVIFAGSQQRKPQGMAEAVLTLDNADGWLPIDFAEVTVGRRAYRSGESEYLINGARARLRDVVELLGEGRLGANELVVVGQGTVDAALSLRPEERRQLFEEAAGVKNLQVRKNEALARLNRANDNLARLTDLVAELRPQVRRLAQQARHQQEHDTLRSRARALVIESHRRREAAARSALGEARRRAAAAEAELESFRAAQEAGRAEIEAAEQRYWAADAAAREAATQREGTREAAIRAEGRLDALQARQAESAAGVERAERELEAARSRLASLPQDEDAEEISRLAAAAADAEARWRDAGAALAAADASLLAAEEAVAARRHERAARLAAEARRVEELAAAVARRERIEREVADAEREREVLGARDVSAQSELTAAAAAEQELRDRLAVARAELEHADQQLAVTRRGVTELSERRDALRAQVEALRERVEAENEVSAALVAAGWRPLLAELQAPEEAWPAIEAIVGGELGDALVWRDGDLARRLDGRRGIVRLLADDADAKRRDEALAAVGANRTVAEWIGLASGPAVLHRAVVAETLDALLRGWRSLPAGWLAVTQEGDLADARGVLTLRGRASAPGGAAARVHARRRELAELLARVEREVDDAQQRHAVAQAEATAAGTAFEAARQAHDEAERRLRQARSASEAAAARAARAVREADRLHEQLAAAQSASGRLEAPLETEDGDEGEVDRLARQAASARDARARIAADRDASRAAWQAARSALDQAEARSAGGRRERTTLAGRIAQLEADLPGVRDMHGALDGQLAVAREAAAETQRADASAAKQRAAAEAERERLRRELVALERASEDSARAAELERAAQLTAIEASRHEEALAGLRRERELALEGFEPDAAPEAGDPADPEKRSDGSVEEARAAAGLDDDSLESELRRVRRTLGQIGSVNPFAVEEHRELAERLADLEAQDADLRNASEATHELIARLDAEIVERFNLAFVAIGERFDEFCRLLFAGGSASLQLAEAGEGDAVGGIEIVVQPPGKRPQRLGMLSGGERALTGVALLFAMLSVNPVPFCVLDEVDAALDEANIGRFAEALRRLAQQIDFVVITHNRATMEVADTIYGVTMTDAAVSRVLSLRLADLPAADPAPVGDAGATLTAGASA